MSKDVTRAFAPGRVNLIGEHTDYNGGLALPFAVRAGVTVTATALRHPTVHVVALDLNQEDRFPLDGVRRVRGWRAYARGTIAELQAAGVRLPGVSLQITGDLPRGAGLSSSAALTVALCLALAALAETELLNRMQLARLCQRVENDWVGAQTGLLDQICSLFAEPDHAVLIDFQTLALAQFPLELGSHRLVTLSSGERERSARSAYNQRRQECVEAAHRMGAESLRGALIQDLHMLPDVLARRAKHVITEIGRVQQAVAALEQRDFERLGRLLDLSHASLRDDFEVSSEAVEAAVLELKAAGALGARLIGGGFGGMVLGLMPPGAAAPLRATVVAPGPGAHLVG